MLSPDPPQCPPGLLERAAGFPPVRTIIAGADSAMAMESALAASEAGLIEPVFVGRGPVVLEKAGELGWDIAAFDRVEAAGEHSVAAEAARLAGAGAAQALMKGQVHTDIFMAALLAPDAGIRTGRRMTHAFHMSVAGFKRALIIADAALNVAPDIETKQAIIENSIALARAAGVPEPKVALLSATESVSEKMPSSADAAMLTQWAAHLPGAQVYGPLAFDNIVSREAALMKGIDHPVAGDTDIVVAPNIECGNALYKMMVYFIGACAAGLVLGGRIPVMLTSRADPPAARLASAALAVLVANAA
jgi:phosphotransacetylase